MLQSKLGYLLKIAIPVLYYWLKVTLSWHHAQAQNTSHGGSIFLWIKRFHHYKRICLSHPQPVKGETNKIPNCKVKSKIYTTYQWMGIFTKFFETCFPHFVFCWYFYLRVHSFSYSPSSERKQSIKSRLHGLPDFVKIYFAMRAYYQLLLQTWDACLITDDCHRKVLPINWWEF